MTVDRMTAPPSSPQQKLHLQPFSPPSQAVLVSLNQRRLVCSSLPVRRQTASIFWLLSVHIPGCVPDLPAVEAIRFLKEMCFGAALHEPGGEEYPLIMSSSPLLTLL